MINYFDFFEINEAFSIDEGALRKSFILNSRKYHPDFHTLSDEASQEQVLELSTINNDGYNVLKDRFKRMQHLLTIKNKMPEEGQAQVPQEFLMEMMDINEALMELEFDASVAAKEKVLTDIADLEKTLHQEGQNAMDAWDEDHEDSFLDLIVDYYLKMKYIIRIKERIQ